jgi:hypothetical protein
MWMKNSKYMSCRHSKSTGKRERASDDERAAGADPSALAPTMAVVSATLAPRTHHEARGEKVEGEKADGGSRVGDSEGT